MRWWWRRHSDEIVEDLRKVAFLQGQLDNALSSLTAALAELQQIIEPRDEESADA